MGHSFKQLWQYRRLMMALVGRHLRARYRGSALGFIWSFLNPLFLIAVYSLVFRYYVRFDAVENYALFLFAGLMPWIWFSSGLLEATSSISAGGSLITKAMFPPQVLPTVAVITNLVHFLFAIPLLLGVMLICGVTPGYSLLLLPVIIVIQTIFMLGLAFAFSALNVFYRDVQHILGNVLTLWFFLCPILYPVDVVPEKFRFTLLLNPMSYVVSVYQDIFVYAELPQWSYIVGPFIASVVVLFFGVVIFEKNRDSFAELV